jgi:hypothetical protein
MEVIYTVRLVRTVAKAGAIRSFLLWITFICCNYLAQCSTLDNIACACYYMNIINNDHNMNNFFNDMKQTQWWNAQYNNFDARSEEAQAWLLSQGYVIGNVTDKDDEFYNCILTGFNTVEPTYRNHNAWDAKDSEAYSQPVLRGLIQKNTIIEKSKEEIENLKNEIEEDKIYSAKRIETVIKNVTVIKRGDYYYAGLTNKFTTEEEAEKAKITIIENYIKEENLKIQNKIDKLNQLTNLINSL